MLFWLLVVEFSGSASPLASKNRIVLDMDSVRMFVSHWDASGNDTYTSAHPAVTTTINVATTSTVVLTETCVSTTNSTVWMIDETCQSRDLWVEMGSPDVPTQKQIEALKARSIVKPRSVTWTSKCDLADDVTNEKGCVWSTTMDFAANTAAVIELPANQNNIC